MVNGTISYADQARHKVIIALPQSQGKINVIGRGRSGNSFLKQVRMEEFNHEQI